MLSGRVGRRAALGALGAAAALLGLLHAISPRISTRGHEEEVRIMRYEASSLSLVFAAERVKGFWVEMPTKARDGSGPGELRGVGEREVIPGHGALGIKFGAARGSVAARFGRPVSSRGAVRLGHFTGLDFYRTRDGCVMADISEDRVTGIAGWAVDFHSPLGLEYGMDLAQVRMLLGPSQVEEAAVFYRVVANTVYRMSLLAFLVGMIGGAVLISSLGAISGKRGLAGSILLASVFIGGTAYWLKLSPLVSPGYYPTGRGPAFGALTWLGAWLGGAGGGVALAHFLRARGSTRGLWAGWRWILGRAIAGCVGAVLAAAGLGALLRACERVRLVAPHWDLSSSPSGVWIAAGLVGALAAIVSGAASREECGGNTHAGGAVAPEAPSSSPWVSRLAYVGAVPVSCLCQWIAMGVTTAAGAMLAARVHLVGVDLAVACMTLLPALLGGLTPGVIIGVLWPRQRFVTVPAVLGLSVIWVWFATLPAGGPAGGKMVYSSVAIPLFWATVALNIGAFAVAYVVMRRWRLRRVFRSLAQGPLVSA